MSTIVQVEVFVALEPAKCQTLVNQFLKKIDNQHVRDVKYQVTSSADFGDIQYTALVVYEKSVDRD